MTSARQGAADGSDAAVGPVGNANAEPVTFVAISEGTFTGSSDVIVVEGSARITVAVSSAPSTQDPECHVNWVVPSGKLASVNFDGALGNLYLPMNNGRSDVVGPMPVVLPKLYLSCKNVTGPVDYVVYGIK